jgi:hypothetical protein
MTFFEILVHFNFNKSLNISDKTLIYIIINSFGVLIKSRNIAIIKFTINININKNSKIMIAIVGVATCAVLVSSYIATVKRENN